MSPEFDLRLDSMRRAMTNVVLPAIDPTDSLAIEQASLVVAHLTMMMQQWDKVDAYARLCLDDIRALTGALQTAGGAQTIAAAAALRDAVDTADGSPGKIFRRAMAALEALVRAAEIDADPAFRRHLHREVLLHGNRQAARDRVWFAASGFDVNVSRLPTIEELLVPR